MKKLVLATAAVLMMSAGNGYAAVPVSAAIEVGNYTARESQATANLVVRYNDAEMNPIYEPATMVQVWARHSCGSAFTTVTVELHNGIAVTMKKGLDYTFHVPLIWVIGS